MLSRLYAATFVEILDKPSSVDVQGIVLYSVGFQMLPNLCKRHLCYYERDS